MSGGGGGGGGGVDTNDWCIILTEEPLMLRASRNIKLNTFFYMGRVMGTIHVNHWICHLLSDKT